MWRRVWSKDYITLLRLLFEEMNRNIYLAMDEDNLGVLQVDVAEEFVRKFTILDRVKTSFGLG